MRCRCGAELGHLNKSGEPTVRMRGVVLKAQGAVAICPKCSADVPFTADLAKALSNRLALFFTGEPTKR